VRRDDFLARQGCSLSGARGSGMEHDGIAGRRSELAAHAVGRRPSHRRWRYTGLRDLRSGDRYMGSDRRPSILSKTAHGHLACGRARACCRRRLGGAGDHCGPTGPVGAQPELGPGRWQHGQRPSRAYRNTLAERQGPDRDGFHDRHGRALRSRGDGKSVVERGRHRHWTCQRGSNSSPCRSRPCRGRH
jgi:hypothetical protein